MTSRREQVHVENMHIPTVLPPPSTLFNSTVGRYVRFTSQRAPPRPTVWSHEKGHYSCASWTGSFTLPKRKCNCLSSQNKKKIKWDLKRSPVSPPLITSALGYFWECRDWSVPRGPCYLAVLSFLLHSSPRLLHAVPGVLALVGAAVNYLRLLLARVQLPTKGKWSHSERKTTNWGPLLQWFLHCDMPGRPCGLPRWIVIFKNVSKIRQSKVIAWLITGFCSDSPAGKIA